jgi:zinc transporter
VLRVKHDAARPLAARQGDELQRIARQVTDRLADIEDELLAGDHPTRSADLSQLKRLMVRLQRVLAPDPAALMRLLAMPPSWHLRSTNEEFALVLADIAALQERIKPLQDESALRVAEANNRSLFTLTMVTVLALPINLGAGLMGMNVGGIPFADHRAGFWIVAALIGITTMVLARVLRRLLRPRRRDRR